MGLGAEHCTNGASYKFLHVLGASGHDARGGGPRHFRIKSAAREQDIVSNVVDSCEHQFLLLSSVLKASTGVGGF